MEPSTKSRTIEIDGMTGDACVQKVTTALKGVTGVTTQSVKVGSATITSDDQSKCHAACAAINAAGFKSRETQGPIAGAGSSCTQPAKEHAGATNGAVNGAPAKKVETPSPKVGVTTVETVAAPVAVAGHA